MINRFSSPLLDFSRPVKRLLALSIDACMCALTVWLALCLRFESWVVPSNNQWIAMAIALIVALPIFVVFGLYRAIFRYAGMAAMGAVTKAIVVYGVIFAALLTVLALPGVPRTLGVLQPLLLLLMVFCSRALGRLALSGEYMSRIKRGGLPAVLIYGAGSAGRQLAGALSSSFEMRAVGFLDDDARLHGQELSGLRIYDPAHVVHLVNKLGVSNVLLAMPSASRHRRNKILDSMQSVQIAVRTLPGLMDFAHGRVEASELRELDIDDLLGREVVPPDASLMEKNITHKLVLVTGAGGSIGSELCRQIVRLRPSTLLLVELSEFALYTVHQDLLRLLEREGLRAVELLPLLASSRDEKRMREIVNTWRPQTVYHAAAYKHVPMVEHNPAEGIKNNVLGTFRLAKVCAELGVADFVLISTDKAVRPTNIMGASKRLAEMVLQAFAADQQQGWTTCFSMVRFGNVLGSSGSVVPLFRRQIKGGGPITLTNKEVTRYFMTIPEAAQLVIQAGAMAKTGDVFVLNMGDPIRIMDLARRMVELSGMSIRDERNPDGDIEIQTTGLRPGEKLYEELLIGDNPLPTLHSRIMKAREEFLELPVLTAQMQILEAALKANDVPQIRALLKGLVPGYQPTGDVVDWVHLAQLE